jgi:hypothetical protein
MVGADRQAVLDLIETDPLKIEGLVDEMTIMAWDLVHRLSGAIKNLTATDTPRGKRMQTIGAGYPRTLLDFGVDRGAGPGWGGHYSTAFRMVSMAAMRVRTSDKSASMAARLVAIRD